MIFCANSIESKKTFASVLSTMWRHSLRAPLRISRAKYFRFCVPLTYLTLRPNNNNFLINKKKKKKFLLTINGILRLIVRFYCWLIVQSLEACYLFIYLFIYFFTQALFLNRPFLSCPNPLLRFNARLKAESHKLIWKWLFFSYFHMNAFALGLVNCESREAMPLAISKQRACYCSSCILIPNLQK